MSKNKVDIEKQPLYFFKNNTSKKVTLEEIKEYKKDEIIETMKQIGLRLSHYSLYDKEELLEILEDKVKDTLTDLTQKKRKDKVSDYFSTVVTSPEHLFALFVEHYEDIKAKDIKEITNSRGDVIKILHTRFKLTKFLLDTGLTKTKWNMFKSNEDFKDVCEYIELAEEDAVLNALDKQLIPASLNNIYLAKYGYTTKVESKVDATATIETPIFHDIVAEILGKKK